MLKFGIERMSRRTRTLRQKRPRTRYEVKFSKNDWTPGRERAPEVPLAKIQNLYRRRV